MEQATELQLDRSSWQPVKFGDVAIQQKESVDRDNTELTRYVKGEHMGSEDLHIREWGELTDEYLGPAFIRKFEEGDILYGSRRTYLRKVAIAHFDGITSNTTFVIKANEAKIDKRLLPFVMLSEGFAGHSIRNSKGSVNPYINWKDIANYEFLLPPVDQQAKLAELLWAMDAVLSSYHKMLCSHERVTDAFRMDFFNDKNWPKIKLKKFFNVQLGKMLSSKAKTGQNSFFYLANQNVQWGEINLEKLNKMDFNENERLKFSLIPGDLLVCEGGEVGRSAIWNGEIQNCYYQKALHRLRVINNSYLPEVMLQFMLLANSQGAFKALTGHSTIAHLTAIKLKEMYIPNIPINSQHEIKRKFEHLDDAKLKIQTYIRNAKQLQKSVINQLF